MARVGEHLLDLASASSFDTRTRLTRSRTEIMSQYSVLKYSLLKDVRERIPNHGGSCKGSITATRSLRRSLG